MGRCDVWHLPPSAIRVRLLIVKASDGSDVNRLIESAVLDMADKSHAGAAPSQTCFMCSVPSLSRSDSPGPEVEDDPRTSELKKVSGSRRRVPERESSDYSHPLWEARVDGRCWADELGMAHAVDREQWGADGIDAGG